MKLSMANFTPKNHRTTNLEAAAGAAKVLFLVIGIASTAFLVARFAFPYSLGLLSLLPLPKLWSYAASWLSPRYLFITVHFIIMVIWKLHRSQDPQDVVIDHYSPVDIAITESAKNDVEMSAEKSSQESEPYPSSEIVDEERSTDQQLPWPPPEPEPESEIKEIQEDGLDATWQAIMNGKSTPAKNQLKKSDTWEKSDTFRQKRDADAGDSLIEKTRALARAEAVDIRKFKKSDTFRQKRDDPVTEKREMRKSKTFREPTATEAARAGAGWRGRDVLVGGRDELFGRVEAFIKMNYEQMRLQRQESEQRFAVNATAY